MEPIGGLHHVTAITADAGRNLDFYTRTLGMRLVKKTVNQDDVSAYHLFYADGAGSPGTDLTFFHWAWAAADRPGAGTIGPIGLRVDGARAVEWWREAFDRLGVPHGEVEDHFGRPALDFTDFEGQRLRLVSDAGMAGGRRWERSVVPAEFQIKGLDSVTLTSLRPEATAMALERALGFRQTGEAPLPDGAVERTYEVGPGGAGATVHLNVPRAAAAGRPGRGGVHHVAFRVRDDAAQAHWRRAVEEAGLQPTPVIDRFYFRSVYFREPGGVLFEIATDGPGFAADEPPDRMGETLALPPFLEPQRERIEAGLDPLPG